MHEATLEHLKRDGRIVVVGASLAGLRAAETIRDKGFTGSLTMIGDEPYEPYDRPPLSKGVLLGKSRAEAHRHCPRRREPSTPSGGSAYRPSASTWRPGGVKLADGDRGSTVRPAADRRPAYEARTWPTRKRGRLDGVFVAAHPRRRARRWRGDSTRGRPPRVLVDRRRFHRLARSPSSVPGARAGGHRRRTRRTRPWSGALGAGWIGGRGRRATSESRSVEPAYRRPWSPALRGRLHRTAYGARAPLRRHHAWIADVVVVVVGAAQRNTEWLAGLGASATGPARHRLRRGLPGPSTSDGLPSPTTSTWRGTWPAPRNPLVRSTSSFPWSTGAMPSPRRSPRGAQHAQRESTDRRPPPSGSSLLVLASSGSTSNP